MTYTTLGCTGLRVSVAGLGGGGFSRFGQGHGHGHGHGRSVAQSIDVVRAALDAGVNFIDTAERYGTEDIVGQALKPSERDHVVISTKTLIAEAGQRRSPEQVVASLHASLKRLRAERVEVFHLHPVTPKDVDYCVEVIAPALLKERHAGRIGYLGITETAPNDPTHAMLPKAIESGLFDMVMVAFHLLHQNARHGVFPLTQASGVATLLMFAVRLVFSQPGLLQSTLSDLVQRGELPASAVDDEAPLAFLADPLPPAAVALARDRFGHLVGVVLDVPINPTKT